MRNIALLEWGPASLFYIQPRELIQVRSGWLDAGPVLPPFLSTMEEAKGHAPDIVVRYAFSAFEDLNSAIRNLRRCFGFPYQEYIGYLNTLTRQHRTRREHEGHVDRLRRWAMLRNVDAVFWIDYTKANQPPGSFKMGPQESRPFSPAHMQLCTDVIENLRLEDMDIESEGAWSDQEKDEKDKDKEKEKNGEGLKSLKEGASMGGSVREQGSLRPFPQKRLPKSAYSVRAAHMLAPAPDAKSALSGAPTEEAASPAPKAPPAEESLETDGDGFSKERLTNKGKGEQDMLRTMLQEEYVPGPGSIYSRSIVPGPGYYGAPKAPSEKMKEAPTFGVKMKSHIDYVKDFAAKLPGPGEYAAKAEMTASSEMVGKLGCFSKAPKMVATEDARKKLPFISKLSSATEGYGLDSSISFHCVPPDAPHSARYARQPKYSFSKTRRPF
eukprot:TRINITY_DN91300_c0_g1_i1.p1 TRINITY_DN91300_c0_g1~~TRINITY_DN91300_c0_g1_i1.p1  ORF type:complete len:440 (+),score=100.36 TRINITY_DN91300_c0_g1_i1:114-1433(+)